MSLGLDKIHSFRELITTELTNNNLIVQKVMISNIKKTCVIFIVCKDRTATVELDKKMLKQIIKNTKESLSLTYLVLNIEWRF